jgi:outer membrane protein assembly factor BamA
MRRLSLLFFIGLSSLLSGCAHKKVQGEWLRQVHFDGNELKGLENPTNDAVLSDAMEQNHGLRPTFFRPRQDISRLDRSLLEEDGRRLETLYAHHGYFDAEVDGWVLKRPNVREKRRLKPVNVRGIVRPREPSVVQSVTLDGLPAGPLYNTLRDRIELKEGDVFELEAYQRGVSAIRTELQERSYAYAKVEGHVEVDPGNHQVRVAVKVERGPACRFGPVQVTGAKKVPKKRLEIDVKEGEPYHLSTLEATRRKLFALRVFRLVNVTPDLSDPTRTTIPVKVELREAKTKSVRLGLIALYESGKISSGASAVYEDWNLFQQLWTLQQEVYAGIGYTDRLAPIASIKGTVNFHNFPVHGLDFLQSGGVEQALEVGYQRRSAAYNPSIAWVGWDRHILSVGYRLKFTDYVFSSQAVLDALAAEEEDGVLEDPYLLSILEQNWTYEGRNDPFSPSRGWYWVLQFAEAGGPFGGDYGFFRVAGEIRTYRSIVRLGGWDPNVVVAARLGAGVELPYSADGKGAVPLDERFFLGGGDTVRGWGYQRLGPRIGVSDTAEGGLIRAFGSFELRKELLWGVSAAGFVDAGRLWDDFSTLNARDIQWTVGGGARYRSIAGPLRLDVGVRLGEDPYGDNPRVTLHFGLGEAF